jgi:pheromone shutdown protein TraB
MSPAMTKLFMHARDRLVTEALDTLVSGRGAEPIVVGVVYGAGHMPAVVHSLAACGFKPRNAEWLTVSAMTRRRGLPELGWSGTGR